MQKLGTLYDDTAEDMLKAGAAVLAARLKAAGAEFAKYIKVRKPKKNKYGWFAQIHFSGKTSSGAPAALAANVCEYGRGGDNPQPARPFVRPTIEPSEKEIRATDNTSNPDLINMGTQEQIRVNRDMEPRRHPDMDRVWGEALELRNTEFSKDC